MSAFPRWGWNAVLAIGLFVCIVWNPSDDGLHRRTEAAQGGAKGLPKFILIIRHAEKPEAGSGLAPAGVQRAQAYIEYFQHFQDGPELLHLDTLIGALASLA